MQSQDKLDQWSRMVRDILATEADDPKLEGNIGDDQSYEEWGRGVGALHLLGRLEPWGGQVLEVIVKYAGTYRPPADWPFSTPHPEMEPLPGIPAHYLCNGGPDGSYEHLRDKQPDAAFWKRLDRLILVVSTAKSSRVRFYLKQLNKSATGFRGVQTAAYGITAYAAPSNPSPRQQPIARGGVINLSRDPK